MQVTQILGPWAVSLFFQGPSTWYVHKGGWEDEALQGVHESSNVCVYIAVNLYNFDIRTGNIGSVIRPFLILGGRGTTTCIWCLSRYISCISVCTAYVLCSPQRRKGRRRKGWKGRGNIRREIKGERRREAGREGKRSVSTNTVGLIRSPTSTSNQDQHL